MFDYWKFTELKDGTSSDLMDQIKNCILSILRSDEVHNDITTVKGTLGQNIENLVISLKRAHTNTLNTQNDLLLTFLTKVFQDILKKPEAKTSLDTFLSNTPELNLMTTNKSILKLLTQAMTHLSNPSKWP